MGSGTDGILYATATRTATCMCVTSIGTTTDGIGATTGWTTIGTTTIPRLCAQLSLFLSQLLREFYFAFLYFSANIKALWILKK